VCLIGNNSLALPIAIDIPEPKTSINSKRIDSADTFEACGQVCIQLPRSFQPPPSLLHPWGQLQHHDSGGQDTKANRLSAQVNWERAVLPLLVGG